MIQNEAMGEISIEKEMRKSYLDYAMSVIIGRALPDVRDGLKPVHRRVLFAMRELKNDYNKPYKKSARIVDHLSIACLPGLAFRACRKAAFFGPKVP